MFGISNYVQKNARSMLFCPAPDMQICTSEKEQQEKQDKMESAIKCPIDENKKKDKGTCADKDYTPPQTKEKKKIQVKGGSTVSSDFFNVKLGDTGIPVWVAIGTIIALVIVTK